MGFIFTTIVMGSGYNLTKNLLLRIKKLTIYIMDRAKNCIYKE